MALNVAVQMDPIDKINIAGDSTFALLLEARARGHKLLYYTPDKLSLSEGRVVAAAAPLEVRDVKGEHFTLGSTQTTDLAGLDVILLRQDPPFDIAYITSTHLLQHLQPNVLIVNDPAGVRNAPEKLFVMSFPQLMPPTLITRDKGAIEAFLDAHGEAVMKPLHGHGGAAVFKITRRDPNFGSLYDLFAASFREPWVVQRFLPQVAKGDKRIILVDGVAAGAVAGSVLRSRRPPVVIVRTFGPWEAARAGGIIKPVDMAGAADGLPGMSVIPASGRAGPCASAGWPTPGVVRDAI